MEFSIRFVILTYVIGDYLIVEAGLLDQVFGDNNQKRGKALDTNFLDLLQLNREPGRNAFGINRPTTNNGITGNAVDKQKLHELIDRLNKLSEVAKEKQNNADTTAKPGVDNGNNINNYNGNSNNGFIQNNNTTMNNNNNLRPDNNDNGKPNNEDKPNESNNNIPNDTWKLLKARKIVFQVKPVKPDNEDNDFNDTAYYLK